MFSPPSFLLGNRVIGIRIYRAQMPVFCACIQLKQPNPFYAAHIPLLMISIPGYQYQHKRLTFPVANLASSNSIKRCQRQVVPDAISSKLRRGSGIWRFAGDRWATLPLFERAMDRGVGKADVGTLSLSITSLVINKECSCWGILFVLLCPMHDIGKRSSHPSRRGMSYFDLIPELGG